MPLHVSCVQTEWGKLIYGVGKRAEVEVCERPSSEGSVSSKP
jgi:hypothetical protein